MNYGSVCSGVESATLAWEHLGWKAKFFAEVEPFPSAVLCQKFGATRPLRTLDPTEADNEKERKQRESWNKQIAKLPNYGKIPNLGDFTKIKESDYNGTIDLLVGGFPCQSFSNAGARKGLADARGNLALEFINLAFKTKSRVFVAENVPGLLSCDRGEAFAEILSRFCGWRVPIPKGGWKKCGIVTNAPNHYGVAWRILDAQYTRVPAFPRAVPQRRRRIFIVGHFNNWQYPAQVLFDSEMCGGNTPPSRTKRQRLATSTERSIDSANTIRLRGGKPGGGKGCLWGRELSHTLATGNDQTIVTFTEEQGTPCAFDLRKTYTATPELAPTLVCTDYKGGKAICYGVAGATVNAEVSEEIQPTLKARNQGDSYICFENHEMDARYKEIDVSTTITSRVVTNSPLVSDAICFENHGSDSRIKEVPVSPTITSRAGTGGNNLPYILNKPMTKNRQHEDGEQSNLGDSSVIGFIKNDAGGEQQGYWEDVFPTVRSQVTPAIAQKECFNVTFCDANGTRQDRANGGLYVTEAQTSKTITSNGTNAETVIIEDPIALDGDKISKNERKGGAGFGINQDGVMYTQTAKDVHAVAYKSTVRRLMPIECERLMGFPDDHTLISWKGLPENECPDGPRYKACGNSMCVNVMMWIGFRINEIEKTIGVKNE